MNCFARCGIALMRYWLVGSNFLVILIGAIILIVSGVMKAQGVETWFEDLEKYEGGETLAKVSHHAPNAAVGFGGAIFGLGFIGCFGAYTQSRCSRYVLLIYSFILCILCIAELATVSGGFVLIATTERGGLKNGLAKAMSAMWASDHTEAQYRIETIFRCCGTLNSTDATPEPGNAKWQCPTAWKSGCINAITEGIESNQEKVGYCLIAAVLFQLVAIFVSCCLLRLLNRAYREEQIHRAAQPDNGKQAQEMAKRQQAEDAGIAALAKTPAPAPVAAAPAPVPTAAAAAAAPAKKTMSFFSKKGDGQV